jgi:hypothetical protein
MSHAFWIKRFLVVAIAAFAVLTLAQLLRGHELVAAVTFGLSWGVLTSVIFTGTRMYRSSKGQHCAICNDTPEPK